MPTTGTESDDRQSRAFFLRTRKEAIVAGAIWAIFFVWVVGVSYVMGYGPVDPENLVLGFPAWVFWGVLVPFVAATTGSARRFRRRTSSTASPTTGANPTPTSTACPSA